MTALKYIFELNKFSVEKRIWVSKNTIAVDVFQNAVRVACAVNELEWAEDFINNHGEYLEDIQQKDTIVLAKASILLKQRRYSEILETLALVNFQNVFNSAFARATQLIAYFELEGYEELFYNHIKAFKLFLHRNTILSVKHKKSFNNFISFAKRLKNAFTEYQPNVKQLEKNIIECNDILYQTWLLEKVNELKRELNC